MEKEQTDRKGEEEGGWAAELAKAFGDVQHPCIYHLALVVAVWPAGELLLLLHALDARLRRLKSRSSDRATAIDRQTDGQTDSKMYDDL